MRGNPIYAQHTPDNIDPIKYSKGFLLNLISYIVPQLFKTLYNLKKSNYWIKHLIFDKL